MASAMQMSTGDLKNNIRKLQYELRQIKYQQDLDLNGVISGSTSVYLPVYHYVFLDYSKPVSLLLIQHKIELFAKSDKKFIDTMFQALRELFNYKPPLNKDQFLTEGFAECKVIMCAQVLHLVRSKHLELTPASLKSSVKTKQTEKSVGSEKGVSEVRIEEHINGINGNEMGTSRNGASSLNNGATKLSNGNIRTVQTGQNKGPIAHNGLMNKMSLDTGSASNSLTHQDDVGCSARHCVMRQGAHEGLGQSTMMKRGAVSVVRETDSGVTGRGISSGNSSGYSGRGSAGYSEENYRDEMADAVPRGVRLGSAGDGGGLMGGGGWVDGRESKESVDMMLNMLSSVSQTLVSLVQRVDSLGERVCRVEQCVSDQMRNNLSSIHQSGDTQQPSHRDSQVLHSHDTGHDKYATGNTDRISGNGLVGNIMNVENKILQSMNTVNARLTLLENSVTLLSNQQQGQKSHDVEKLSNDHASRENYYMNDDTSGRVRPRNNHLLETEEFTKGIDTSQSSGSSHRSTGYSPQSIRDFPQNRSSSSSKDYIESSRPDNLHFSSSTHQTSSYPTSATFPPVPASDDSYTRLSHSTYRSEQYTDRQGIRLAPANDESVLSADTCQSFQPANGESVLSNDSRQSSHPATPPSLRSSSRVVESPPTKDVSHRDQAGRIEALLESTRRLLSQNLIVDRDDAETTRKYV